MRLCFTIGVMALVLLAACNKKKEGEPGPTPPPPAVFLKDIVIPNLPSPYYYFEYDAAGKIVFASHASGDRNYEVLYNGGKISELRNNIMINHDTLRYFYDAAGKVSVIRYINENNVTYKRAFLTYNGNRLSRIEWDIIQQSGYAIDRTIDYTYMADGNLSEMTDHVLPVNGQFETTRTT